MANFPYTPAPNDNSFGDRYNAADAQPTHNPAMAPGAILSQRGTVYNDDTVRHVQLVSRTQDASGQGIWTVNEITYGDDGAVTVGAQSTVSEAQLNGRWIASSI